MKKNSGIILIGAAAAAYFLLGSKKSSAKEKAPELKAGDVVDAGTMIDQASGNVSYEWRVVVDSLTPGFGTGAMYRGEWRIAGDSQYTVASSASGASSFADPNAAKNNALQAIGLHDENQYG